MTAPVRRYVGSWLAVGLTATAMLLLAFPPGRAELARLPHGPLTLLLFVVLVALAEATELRLVHASSVKAFTLVEAAVVPSILLFPPSWALLVVLGGVALGQLVRRRSAFQLAFNLGQFAIACSVAVIITDLLRAEAPPLAWRSLVGVAIGTGVFAVVNTSAVTGIMARLERRPVGEMLRQEAGLNTLNVASNTVLGILIAVLWVHEPQLLPLVLAPGFAIHLAYRGLLRSDQLLTEVRAQNVRLDRVVQGATDGIALLDRDGVVEIWNPTMAALSGIDADEAVGRPLRGLLDVVEPDGAPADPLAALERARPDAPVATGELVVAHRDGGGHRVLFTHGFLFDDHDRLVGDVLLLRDVTRQREVEHLKDDFIARITHELRTPLTPIRGFAESILQHDADLDASTRRTMLSRIVERTDHMIRLVDDLLLVPQLSGASSDRDLDVVGPGELLAFVEAAAAGLAGTATDVEIAGEADLPDVAADRRWLELIVDHLLSNAAKFALPGSPVEVELRAADHGLAASVTDHGRGIPADQLERIFDRFHRTERPLTMETGGLGIGLYVARQLARRMGGDLTVTSRLGQGSTFTLLLAAAGGPGGGPVMPSTTGTPTAAGRRGRAGPAGPPPDRRTGSDPAP